MNKIAQKLKTLSITALLICFTGISQTAYADIGLPDGPLVLGTAVQPNIFLGLDDSGSMIYGFLINNAASYGQGTGDRFRLAGTVSRYQQPTVFHTPLNSVRLRFSVPSEEFLMRVANEPTTTLYTNARKNRAASDLLEIWRVWTYEFNQMYYNPETTYVPWSGVDRLGNAYTNANPTAAPTDPYDTRDRFRLGNTLNPRRPAPGTPARLLTDLTTNFPDYTTRWNGVYWKTTSAPSNASGLDEGPPVDGFYLARYYAWNDTNTTTPSRTGNGLVDRNDFHTKIEIRSTTATYSTDGGLTDRSGRNDCAAVPVCTYAEEIQNFANWFTYHRNRLLVMKRAVSELIDSSSARMGMALMNRSLGEPITDMTDTSTSPTNKETLMTRLFRTRTGGGTPLREFLKRIGRYFDDTNNFPHGFSFSDDSPILGPEKGGECQQNFVVLLTDGFWNGSDANADVDGLMRGNADGDNNSNFDGGPHGDGFARTLADQAMHYYERDLSTLPNNVKEIEYIDPANGITYIDNNPQQHMVTYGISFGLTGSGLSNPADHEPGTPPPPWRRPVQNRSSTLDDLQHATFNGRGLFLDSNNPEELIRDLNQAIASIDQRTSVSGSSIGINSTALRTTSRVFQASFNSKDWTGELTAFSLNADGTINAEVWTATDKYATITDPDQRNIFTSVSTGGIAFDDNPANAELNTAIGTLTVGATTYTAADLIHYISGDQTNEGTGANDLRERAEILADIVSSSPISIGKQNLGYDTLPGNSGVEGTSYSTFLAAKTAIFTDGSGDPLTAVYVSANDGMLHAFRDSQSAALQGLELFAYIPSSLHGKLSELAEPVYEHKFYVNGSHTVGDACIGSGTCTWKSILVGVLGEGGRTVYALDVTDPFNFDASDVLWEYNFDDTRTGTTNSGGMGFAIKAAPQIVRLNNGDWGVVFGNGYNSDSDTAQIFILDAEDGTEIAVFNTHLGDSSNENGMAAPLIVDEDGDSIADTIYSGDLFGNLFKFDITDSNANSWKTVFEATGPQPRDAEPLFQAVDASSVPQAITTRPTIVTNDESGFNIIFGTGKYIETSDTTVLTPYQVETMYSIWDDDNDGNGSQVVKSDLVEQTIDEEISVTVGIETLTTRIVSENTIDYAGNNPDKGWFMDALKPSLSAATANGERIIVDPLARFGRAIFVTFSPPDNPCEPGGTSVLMEIDALSGARLEDSVFDINGDGIIDEQDFVTDNSGNKVPVSGIYIPGTLTSPTVISLESPVLEAKQFSGIDSETTTVLESTGGIIVGRQSWRQLK